MNSGASSEEVARLVDARRLDEWIGDRLPGAGDQLRVQRITSGASNELFDISRGSYHWVLRRPAEGSQLPRDVMVREFQVLSALGGSDVAHPTPLLLGDDPEVIGACFYLMERIDGFTPRIPLPEAFTDPADRHGLGMALLDALVALGRVDWRGRGLEGFGRPDGYLERQVTRWLGQFDSNRHRDLPGLDEVAAWLEASRPLMAEPTIIHGDFQFANSMFACDPPARLLAIVDWEQSTIGDPLVDLGWLLVLWDEPGEEPIRGPENVRVTRERGFPTRAELAGRYADRAGRSLEHLGWYEVLALFKLACVLEGAHLRWVEGRSNNPRHATLEHMVPALVRSARALVHAGGRPR